MVTFRIGPVSRDIVSSNLNVHSSPPPITMIAPGAAAGRRRAEFWESRRSGIVGEKLLASQPAGTTGATSADYNSLTVSE